MNRIITYFKMALTPWVALYLLFMLMFMVEAATGHFGRYGGISALFREAGLYPGVASIFFWAITGFGMLLVLIALFADACRAAWRKWVAPVWERCLPWMTPPGVAAVAVLAAAILFVLLVPTRHAPSSPLMEKNGIPVLMQKDRQGHEHVLFQVPYLHTFKPIHGAPVPPPERLTHTIHGDAIVTKISPNTYQIRMVPGGAKR